VLASCGRQDNEKGRDPLAADHALARVSGSVPILRVVLLTMDAARLLVGFVMETRPLASADHAVGFDATLDAVQVYLAGSQATRLPHRELTVLHAVDDALTLMVLTRIEPWGIRERGRGDHHGQCCPEHRSLHEILLLSALAGKSGVLPGTTPRGRWR
jgi:hypothetical protein